MFSNRSLSSNVIIALAIALVVVTALVALTRYFIVRDKRMTPKQPAQFVPAPAPVVVSDEVMRSLTPPVGTKSAEISQETLDSLTPPKDAKPAEVPQSVLDSLAPPAK